MSSGCIEVRSKNITMSRWLRSSSGFATPVFALKRLCPSFPITVFSSRAAASSTFSKSKVAMRCGFPFSSTVKSLAVSPWTTAPVFLSRTTTLVSTRSLFTFSVNSDCEVEGCCCARTPTGASTNARARARLKVFILEPVPRGEVELAHGCGGGHFTVGCGADRGIDAGVLDGVEEVVDGGSHFHGFHFAEAMRLGKRNIGGDGSGAGDGEARGCPVSVGWSCERRFVEPVIQRGAAFRERHAGHAIRPQRSRAAARHVKDCRLIARRERVAGGEAEVSGEGNSIQRL